MKILYFAWVREMTGKSGEDFPLPEDVRTVRELVDCLKKQGDSYQSAFADEAVVRVAVNQEYVGLDHAVSDGDEIAFFPPVTGG